MLKKNILIVGPVSQVGGVGKMVISQYELFREMGQNVDLFDLNNLKKIRLELIKLWKAINNSDIVHIHCSFIRFKSSLQIVIPLMFSQLQNKKTIVTYHTGDPEKYFKSRKRYLKLVFKNVDYLTVPSLRQKKLFTKYSIASSEDVKIIHNFVNKHYLEKSISMNEKIKRDKILTTGKISKDNIKRKGFNDFKSIAEMFPEYEFILVGKISDKEAKLYTQKIPSNMIVTGYITKERLADIYKQSKLYLQLSRNESFGMSMVESMAFGCIPIVYNRGALPEILKDGGYVVDNKEEVKDKIECIMLNGSEKNPRDVVLEHYTPEKYFYNFFKLLKDI